MAVEVTVSRMRDQWRRDSIGTYRTGVLTMESIRQDRAESMGDPAAARIVTPRWFAPGFRL